MRRNLVDFTSSPDGRQSAIRGEDAAEIRTERRVLQTDPSLTSFARWSILTMVRVRRMRCFAVLQFQDARFGDPGKGRLGRDVVLPTGRPECFFM